MNTFLFTNQLDKMSSQNHSIGSTTSISQDTSSYGDQSNEITSIMNRNDSCDNGSKSREVSPKLVVRGKKYGRRSRPQSAAPFESSQSDSEEDYDFVKVPTHDAKLKTYQKVSLIILRT